MVAHTRPNGFHIPMICIFDQVYSDSSALIESGASPPPERFNLVHVGFPPKATGYSLTAASISAHGDRFAVTNPAFRSVFVYKMNLV